MKRGIDMELGSREIQEIIPHRWPFLLVDRITDLEPGVGATGIKNVAAGELFSPVISQAIPYSPECL